jgi:dihydrofolate synthase/folylpolyglutamate synthase
VPGTDVRLGGAREAAEAFLGRPVEHEVDVQLPGRLEQRGNEIWDGAHTPDAVDWLLPRLPRHDYVLCVSILDDKDSGGILERLGAAGRVVVATESTNPRSLATKELAARAEPYFEHVEPIADPVAALGRARELAGPNGAVLATGSLYLLADLYVAG